MLKAWFGFLLHSVAPVSTVLRQAHVDDICHYASGEPIGKPVFLDRDSKYEDAAAKADTSESTMASFAPRK